MDRSFCTYKVRSYENNSFFIGANSERGFILSPDNTFDEESFDRVYILKGGAGTGKSTFMKKMAEKGENTGAEVKRYYCSSDPDSLDAVIIETVSQRTLFIDGTHPHVCEMKYPGAISEIINLSSMWDSEKLNICRDSILSLSKKKSDAFASAYKYLGAAAELDRTSFAISQRVCNTEKLISAQERLLAPYKKLKGKSTAVYTEAFSMKGTVCSDVFLRSASEIYYLNDVMGLSSLYLGYLSERLDFYGIAHFKTVSPINSQRLTGLFITGKKVYLTALTYSDQTPWGKKINMKRFLTEDSGDCKGRYRFGEKCKNALLDGAVGCLSEAGRLHRQLEDIYTGAMNFRKVNKIYREKAQQLFSEQDG